MEYFGYCYYALAGVALRAVDYVSDVLVQREEEVVQTFEQPATMGQHKNNVMAASSAIMKGEVFGKRELSPLVGMSKKSGGGNNKGGGSGGRQQRRRNNNNR